MIDLTPLDVRNKRGDFKRVLRGYDPQEVDVFLELVAERLDHLVMENLRLRERSENLHEQVQSQTGREKAVQEALVTAQELRADIRSQAQRGAELVLAEAQTEARRLLAEAEAEAKASVRNAERNLEMGRDALEEMERRRGRFLKQFRQLLERELDVVQVEEERTPLEDRPIEMELMGGRTRSGDEAAREARAAMKAAEGAWDPVDSRSDTQGDPDTAPPPLDASLDELAAGYSGPLAMGEKPVHDPVFDAPDLLDGLADDSEPQDGTLSLSFEDTPPDDDKPRWG